jgi:hypothetical protein
VFRTPQGATKVRVRLPEAGKIPRRQRRSIFRAAGSDNVAENDNGGGSRNAF